MEILNHVIFGLPLYKYIVAIGVFVLFLVLRKVFTITVIKSAQIFVSKTKTQVDDKILSALSKPLDLLFIVVGLYLAAVVIRIDTIVVLLTKSLTIVVVFWFLFNVVKAFQDDILAVFDKKLSHEIGLFILKSLRIFIIAVALLAILQTFGINVSAFIASLGLGGLAFALAAKDTAANLFGGFAILSDKIFKIGDWVKVGDVEGSVEDIGMRTTKIRTADKRLVVLPNAVIANSAVENFSKRDRRRITMKIGLTYSTNIETLQKVLEESKQMLQSHPMVHDEPIFVFFDEFADSSLNVFFSFFVKTADLEEYLRIKEDINLKIISIVDKYDTDFAYPSQSIYFENTLSLNK
ncbi:MAG: mechanosensitive ion channel family protein [Epsilonproteobacteria bacterium]|nr:mechanosensitive ion channel family protein [Campylobacterota bacterium]